MDDDVLDDDDVTASWHRRHELEELEYNHGRGRGTTAAAAAAAAASRVQGPFGRVMVAHAFDDALLASNGGPITRICAFYGEWMNAIQTDYGDQRSAKHGGEGAGVAMLKLALNEFIVAGDVQYDKYDNGAVGSLWLTTSSGRTVALGPDRPDDPFSPPFVSATPVPRRPALHGRALVLKSISGVADCFVENITLTWGENPLTTGPFGRGMGAHGTAFNNNRLSGHGPITAVRAWTGCWMDAIQVDYGGQPSPKHGGGGGSPMPAVLTLEPGETIIAASVQTGWNNYVASARLTTSAGRSVMLGSNLPSHSPFIDATPKCGTVGGRVPVLVAISGVADQYVDDITFQWAFLPTPSPAAVTTCGGSVTGTSRLPSPSMLGGAPPTATRPAGGRAAPYERPTSVAPRPAFVDQGSPGRGAGSSSAAKLARAARSSEDGTCAICLTAERTSGFVHGTSAHACACAACAAMIGVGGRCPMCRGRVEKILWMFM